MEKDPSERHISEAELNEIISDFDEYNIGDLYIVWKRNPYMSVGRFVYLYNEGFQEVKVVQSGRAPGTEEVRGSTGPLWRLRATDGLFYPRTALSPYVRKVPRRP